MSTLSKLQERASGFVTALPAGFARVGLNWSVLRNFSILSGGSALAQGFTLAVTPLITRLYLPANLGQLGLFMAFINVAVLAASLRYEFAIVSARSDREAAQLTLCCFLLALPVGTIAALVFYLLVREGILGYGNMPLYAAVLVIPAMLCTAAFAALRYWLLRKERFGLISHGMVFQNASRALTQAGFGWLGPYTAGLLAGEIIGRCSGMSRMLRAAWPALKRELAGSDFRQIKETLNNNREFALYSLPSSLLDTLATSISLPLVVYLYGLNAGGSFSLVARVLALPAVLITANVADAFHRRAATVAQTNPVALPGLVKRMGGLLLLAGICPAATLIAFGPQLFAWVFGSKWVEAGVMAAWIAPLFLAQFIVSPLSRVVLVVGRQKVKFIYDIITFGGTIAVFAIAHDRQWPVMTAIAVLAGLRTAAYAVFFLLLLNISATHVQQTGAVVGCAGEM
ncbi:MAG TPA: lipopolysaccharide biosynthesis protein [Candidatus Angelobacter sp.]|nr:lipopolysaccharide biosynthesis protein [Candidatus Angelobacter sp.]